MQFKIDRNKFQKDGYCVVKGLLNSDEVNYYDNEIKKLAQNKSHFSLVKRLIPLPSAPKTMAMSSLPFLNDDNLFVEFSSSAITMYPNFFNLIIVWEMFAT